MAVSSCCSLQVQQPVVMALHCHLSQRGEGWGKRFTAASRPGRFQNCHCYQWAAVTRGLEFCEMQPWVCPSAHLPARSGSRRPWGEGRDPPPTTLSVPRTTVRLTEQELCHANGLPLMVTQKGLVQTVSRYWSRAESPC